MRATVIGLAALASLAAASSGCDRVANASAEASAGVPVAEWARRDPISPHFPHIRLQVTDYRIQYQSDADVRAAEYAWTAGHFDRVILDFGDKRSVPAYRRHNPRAQLFRYVLNWTVIRPGEIRGEPRSESDSARMQRWYARHPQYRLEDAFLHDRARCGRPARKSPDCRITFKKWTQMRWATNPGDAGFRAYQRERLAGIVADADGLFIDEHSSGDIRDKLDPRQTLEYGDWASYEQDLLELLRELRATVGARKQLMINTHTYLTPLDSQMVVAAGGVHLEDFNSAFFAEMEKRWRFAESLLRAGTTVDLQAVELDVTPREYTAGSSATPLDRRRLWELASYYLIAPPHVGSFAFATGAKWKAPFADQWWRAVEYDVGRPVGPRRVYAEGRDPRGRRYRVWAREYERALILVRPVIEWPGSREFGDETLVRVTVPSGPHARALRADGRIDPPVGRIGLRAGEAAILVGGGRGVD